MMSNERIKIPPFYFAGISIQTTNSDNQFASDLANLWQRFYQENIVSIVPEAAGSEIYAIYTDYESDYTGKYTALIGLRVNSLEQLPEKLTGRQFHGGNFIHYAAKGMMPQAVINTWMQIWSADKQVNRQYDFDFEVYGNQSNAGEESVVDIFISVK
ncbi:MAG TPA: GyrI-like domain-containing protein [Flavitalea sp.]|nr:GyrI-like domain-containing protein [Flavitalea sp.]